MEEERDDVPSRWEVFGVSGPTHLTSIDWGILDHKRSIAASLIQGVYISERDHQLNRTDKHNALSPVWWEFFHFQRMQVLIDPLDLSIFGAIYAYKPLVPSNSQRVLPPSYVIAFRGTLLKPKTRRRDVYLDVNLPFKVLPHDPRYHRAVQAVIWLINRVGHKTVWLAGHSLGAAIALQVGKDMAKKGTYIETFLFNPPYNSAPVERIQNPILKTKIRVAKSLLTAGLSAVFKGNKDDNTSSPRNDNPFTTLCSWVPNIFVNPRDSISCEYIGYFEHRDKMEAMGMGKIENIATRNSMMSMLSYGALGRDGEPPHLVPSAMLFTNMNGFEHDVIMTSSHGIHQWWQHHSWESKRYVFSECNCQL